MPIRNKQACDNDNNYFLQKRDYWRASEYLLFTLTYF